MSYYKYTLFQRLAQAKQQQGKIAAVLLAAHRSKEADLMNACSNAVKVSTCKSCGKQHIQVMRTSKQRVCPSCQLRKSRKIAANAKEAFAYMMQHDLKQHHKIMLLTLTQRNCAAGTLREEIDKIIKGLRTLQQSRPYRRCVVGAARTIECTYNKQSDTWHPHVHCLVILDTTTQEGAALQSVKWWREKWTNIVNQEVPIICDLKHLLNDGAIYEVSKYVSKMSNFLDTCPKHLQALRLTELVDALKGRQLIAYTGIWANARKALRSDDEIPDEVTTKDKQCDCVEIEHVFMEWTGSKYEKRI